MDKTTMQILLVMVPVLSLIGSWLALKGVATREYRKAAQHKAIEK